MIDKDRAEAILRELALSYEAIEDSESQFNFVVTFPPQSKSTIQLIAHNSHPSFLAVVRAMRLSDKHWSLVQSADHRSVAKLTARFKQLLLLQGSSYHIEMERSNDIPRPRAFQVSNMLDEEKLTRKDLLRVMQHVLNGSILVIAYLEEHFEIIPEVKE